MTWAVYARVSSEKQAADSLSIDAQLRQLREWTRARGYVSREFVDEGKSAWTEDIDKRPAFKSMLDGVRAHDFEGVAVTHLDRFSRKLIVTLSVFGVLGKYGVKFVCLESASLDFSSPMGALMLSTLGAFAEYYSAELSRKIKRGMMERARKGLHVGGLPFGYCNGRCTECKQDGSCERWGTLNKDAAPVMHPADAPGVRLAFDTFRVGTHTDETIALLLNERGYRSRTLRGRELWNRWAVAWLLTNPTYTGRLVVNGEEYDGKQPAIISREVFDDVQRMRREHRSSKRTYAPKYRVYLFSGILVCSGCGRRMRAEAFGNDTHRAYQCTSHQSKKLNCPKPQWHIRAELLEGQFGAIIKELRLPPDWRERIQQMLALDDRQRDVEGERRKLTEKLARLDVMFEMGRKSEKEYREEVKSLKAQLDGLKPRQETAVIDAGAYLEKMSAVWDAATLAEQREMVLVMLQQVVCDPAERHIVAIVPKPAFTAFFRQHPTLRERDGGFRIGPKE